MLRVWGCLNAAFDFNHHVASSALVGCITRNLRCVVGFLQHATVGQMTAIHSHISVNMSCSLHISFLPSVPSCSTSDSEGQMMCGDQSRGYSAQKWPLFIHSDGHLAPLGNRTEMSDLSFTSKNHIYLGLLSLLT